MMEIIGDFVLPASLGIIMYGMGLSLEIDDFKRVLTRRHPIALGILSMMLVVPLVGIVLAVLFAPSPVLAVGIVLLATCPGGMLSNLLTDLAGGDLALSVSMTIAVSAVYVFAVPFIASFAVGYFLGGSSEISLPLLPSFIRILSVTLLPIVLGMATRHRLRQFAERARPILKKFAICILVFAFAVITVDQIEVISQNLNQLMLIVLGLNVSAILIAFAISRIGKLSREETIAICVEHSIRQEGTAMFIAISLLGVPEMSIPMILNTLVGMAVCLLFLFFMRKAKVSQPPVKCS